MNYSGVIIGMAVFLIIGVFHPIVVKAEYYWSKRCWWLFAAIGVAFCTLSLLITNDVLSTLSGVVAFASFWSIKELFEQEERVKKGWFPKNPKRKC